jgi:hypothetical protein
MNNLEFDAETLPPLLPDDSAVTVADVEAAVAEWQKQPPDPDYRNILDATPV